MFGQNKKKLKILKLSRDVRYVQKVALKFGLRMDMKFLIDWKKFSFNNNNMNNNNNNNNNKRYLRLLKKRSEKLVDEESKVVRDRQDDNVLLDHLHSLHGYLTFCGHVYPRRIGRSSHNALRLNYIIVVFDDVNIHLLWISSKSCRKPRQHSAKESLFISIVSISEHRKLFSSINFLVFR